MNSETTSTSHLESQANTSTTSQPSLWRKREGPFRGPSRALKYKKLGQVQPGKVKVNISSYLGAAVGDHALQFRGECSDRIREICLLDVKKWSEITDEVLDRLYGRIKSKFALGEVAYIDKALKTQCSRLYRHRRERLKSEKFSTCKSLKEAESAFPASIKIEQRKWLVYSYWIDHKQREGSEKNWANDLSKKIQSACGAKSMARIIHEMEVEAATSLEAENAKYSEGNSSCSHPSEIDQPVIEPDYVKLWRKTKQQNDGRFDYEGEVKLNEFIVLHKKEIQEKGVDNLYIEEAYIKVLGHLSVYARGLVKGHPVEDKGGKKGKAELEAEIQLLRGDNYAMRAELEVLKAETQRKEEEAQRKQQTALKKLEATKKKLELIMKTLGL